MIPSDETIAAELVSEFMYASRIPPYKFAIMYDAKAGPANVTVHRVARNGTMGIYETNIPKAAEKWATEALLKGYTVVRIVGRDELHSSLVDRRRLYEYRQLTPDQRRAMDDDIPF